jgi:hypothetical protein
MFQGRVMGFERYALISTSIFAMRNKSLAFSLLGRNPKLSCAVLAE